MFNIHGGFRSKSTKINQDYTLLTGTFSTGTQQTEVLVHCLFGDYGRATGRAYFDDLFFREIGPGRQADDPLVIARWFASSAPVDRIAWVLKELEKAETPLARTLLKVISEEPRRTEVFRKFAIDDEVHKRGSAVYVQTCIACHGPDGKGADGVFPPLLGSDWVTDGKEVPIQVVLHGLTGPVAVSGKKFNGVMPPLGGTLNDQQIADVITYVRQKWSNDASSVSAEEVSKVRKKTADRKEMVTAAELHR